MDLLLRTLKIYNNYELVRGEDCEVKLDSSYWMDLRSLYAFLWTSLSVGFTLPALYISTLALHHLVTTLTCLCPNPSRPIVAMGICASATGDREADQRSAEIDKQIVQDSKKFKKECKILLLGMSSIPSYIGIS